MQQLELDFSAPEQLPANLLDYQKYNIAVGQIYARADDVELKPAVIVINVLTHADEGLVCVAAINTYMNDPTWFMDCFKLSKVRYTLVK